MDIKSIKKIKMSILPTPIVKLENISEKIHTNLYMKRDDLTGILLGGNKIRKLEYFLADAMEKKKKTIVTTGSTHSNHNSLTTAICNSLGLKTHLVIVLGKNEAIPKEKEINGNLLIQKLSGANMIFVTEEEKEKTIEELMKKLEEEKEKPYYIPIGGHSPLGLVGYIEAMKEIEEQSKKDGVNFDYIVAAVGTGTTVTGLFLGKEIYHSKAKILGLSVSREIERCREDSKQVITEFNEKFGTKYEFEEQSIEFVDKYRTGGYGEYDQSVYETMKFVIKEEGIIMDPVYTAKSFMGLLKHIEENKELENKNILFVHTGGAPIVFEENSKNFLMSYINKERE